MIRLESGGHYLYQHSTGARLQMDLSYQRCEVEISRNASFMEARLAAYADGDYAYADIPSDFMADPCALFIYVVDLQGSSRTTLGEALCYVLPAPDPARKTHLISDNSGLQHETRYILFAPSPIISDGQPYQATIIPDRGYQVIPGSVHIQMGGADITATAYTGGQIDIPAVSAEVMITARTERRPAK